MEISRENANKKQAQKVAASPKGEGGQKGRG